MREVQAGERCGAGVLIFVSDLHLVDHASRATFESAPMFEAIRSRLKDHPVGDDPVKLVLLGDIFELLKSGVWLKRDIRPWSAPTRELWVAAAEILRDIVAEPSNAHFFEQLQRLRSDFNVELEYIPGNHDGLLADEECRGLRQLLRNLVPGLPGKADEAFRDWVADEAHGVVAEHGHQLDSFNVRNVKSGRFVPGDAVVVEMLVGLPHEVATRRNADEFGSEFEFLHEMDNVEPQNLDGLMRWLEYQMKDVQPNTRRAMQSDVSSALRLCGMRLREAMKAHSSQSLARKALWTLTKHECLTRISVLRFAAWVPTPATSELPEVADRVSEIESTIGDWHVPPDIYIAGHTHSPLQQVFATANGHEMTYLNTGTWRRVQAPVRSRGRVAFREAYHEALVCVHRVALTKQNGRYELKRDVRGR